MGGHCRVHLVRKKGRMRRTIISQLEQFLSNVRSADVLDILVISLIIYLFLVWLRRRASRSLAIALGTIAGLYVLTQALNMYLSAMLFQAGIAAALVVLVIIFQPDIRRTFEHLASWRPGGFRPRVPGDTGFVDELVETVKAMAEDKVGALIVLQGSEAIERHVRGGVAADAKPSYALLYSIFDEHSPGHDGAVLLDNGIITRFGVLLPLSNNLREVGRHGTRHTAALGLVELCDSMALIVSEEHGTVSIAHDGKLKLIDSSATLKRRILDFYHRNESQPAKQRGVLDWMRTNFGLKAGSLGIAFLLWLIFAYRVETVFKTVSVPIEYRNVPSEWIIEPSLPTEAQVTLSGPERSFPMSGVDPTLTVDLAKVESGENDIPLTPEDIPLPQGLVVGRIEPNVIRFSTSTKSEMELPVKVHTDSADGELSFRVVPLTDTVRVEVDADTWGKISHIPTEVVSLKDIRSTVYRNVKLIPPKGVNATVKTPKTIRVRIEVSPREEEQENVTASVP